MLDGSRKVSLIQYYLETGAMSAAERLFSACFLLSRTGTGSKWGHQRVHNQKWSLLRLIVISSSLADSKWSRMNCLCECEVRDPETELGGKMAPTLRRSCEAAVPPFGRTSGAVQRWVKLTQPAKGHARTWATKFPQPKLLQLFMEGNGWPQSWQDLEEVTRQSPASLCIGLCQQWPQHLK